MATAKTPRTARKPAKTATKPPAKAKTRTPAKAKSSLAFRAKLFAPMEGKGWTFLELPEGSAATLGNKSRLAVKGTINGFPFTSSAMPSGRGNHRLAVNQAMRTGAKAEAGDEVKVVLEIDDAPRTVDTPKDFASALAKSKKAREIWEKLAYSHKKLYVEWIDSAKKEETRAARIDKAVGMIAEGKKQR